MSNKIKGAKRIYKLPIVDEVNNRIYKKVLKMAKASYYFKTIHIGSKKLKELIIACSAN